MLRAMLIATVLSLGMLGQPKEATCFNCWTGHCIKGSSCGGQNCVCGCHELQCVCFTIYQVPQALTDGYSFE